MNPSESLTLTLIRLADTVSRNLSLAYTDTCGVSYGEETITETCLLDLKRMHDADVQSHTFSKHKESKVTGADWEWHFLGKKWAASFRVQAKRVKKNGGISGIFQKAKTATDHQVDLLIADADSVNMIPIHCFYCAEEHRTKWVSAPQSQTGQRPFLSGCLIADAKHVRDIHPKKLSEIEAKTVPWHFILLPKTFSETVGLKETRYAQPSREFSTHHSIVQQTTSDFDTDTNWRLPDLNNDTPSSESPKRGLRTRDEFEDNRERLRDIARERSVSRIVEFDVSKIDFFEGSFRD